MQREGSRTGQGEPDERRERNRLSGAEGLGSAAGLVQDAAAEGLTSAAGLAHDGYAECLGNAACLAHGAPAECLGSAAGLVQDAYADVATHRRVTAIVRAHSTTWEDIRDVALRDVPLASCRNILDLGCGFGFFTEALGGRVNADGCVTGIDCVGAYREAFLATCAHAGLKGKFLEGSASLLKTFEERSFDLVLCSYALYFFPEAIPSVARILATTGWFVAILHDRDNMRELVELARRLGPSSSLSRAPLPLESLLGTLASENAPEALGRCFAEVQSIPFPNSIVFERDEADALVTYVKFKAPLLGLAGARDRLGGELEGCVRSLLERTGRYTITKNDTVFVCRGPRCRGPEASRQQTQDPSIGGGKR